MVTWQKPLTIPSCPKIYHRYGLGYPVESIHILCQPPVGKEVAWQLLTKGEGQLRQTIHLTFLTHPKYLPKLCTQKCDPKRLNKFVYSNFWWDATKSRSGYLQQNIREELVGVVFMNCVGNIASTNLKFFRGQIIALVSCVGTICHIACVQLLLMHRASKSQT